MMLAAVVLLAILSVLGCFFAPRRFKASPWIRCTSSVGLASLGITAVLSTIPRGASRIEQPIEIAWTGVEVAPGRNLSFGGSDPSTLKWPGGRLSPAISVSPEGSAYRLMIAEGGGFLLAGSQPLNGRPLSLGGDAVIRDMVVQLRRPNLKDRLRWSLLFKVFSSAGKMIGEWKLARPEDRRIYAVEDIVVQSARRLRTSGDGTAAESLEEWAEGLRLYVDSDLNVRISGNEDVTSATVTIPTTLEVRWPRASQDIQITKSERNGLVLQFRAPWRTTSPLPPASTGSGARVLTVCTTPLPDDRAFVVPAGSAFAGLRVPVELQNARFSQAASLEDSLSRFATVERPFFSPESVSQTRVTAGDYLLRLETVNDVPSALGVGIILAFSLVTLWFALWQLRLVAAGDQPTLASLTLCVWTFLAIRVLLAFRFAFEPEHVDRLAIKGVTVAAIAVASIPPLVALAGILWKERFEVFDDSAVQRRRGARLCFFVLATSLAGLSEVGVVRSLWPNLTVATNSPLKYLGAMLFVLFAATTLHILFRFWWDTSERTHDLTETGQLWIGRLRQLVLEGQAVIKRLVSDVAPRLWEEVTYETESGKDRSEGFARRARSVLGMSLLVLGITLVFIYLWSGTAKYAQECGVITLGWIPALLWLSSRLTLHPDSGERRVYRWRALFISFFMMTVPVFILPLVLHDAGGLVETLAVYIPTVIVLLMGRRPAAIARLAAAGLLVGFAVASIGYVRFDPLMTIAGKLGQLGPRVLAFREGSNVTRALAFLPIDEEQGGTAITATSVQDALEHTWENRAIAHVGGRAGLGFGNAPVRRSHIRQDTLQFDSEYSFYVASEYGAIGGLALLVLYALPVLIVVLSSRQYCDIGHAVALVIAGALLFEAWAHVVMNLGGAPFTGRDLPWLAVASYTDLLRWSFLFCVAAQAVMWRRGGDAEAFVDTVSLLSGLRDDVHGQRAEPSRRFVKRTVLFLATPVALAVAVAGYHSERVLGDPTLGKAFDWSGLLEQVRLVSEHYLDVEATTLKLTVDQQFRHDGTSLLEQEVERFNALPSDIKRELVKSVRHLPPRVGILAARTLKEYDREFLDLIKATSSDAVQLRRPVLFRLIEPRQFVDDEGKIPAVDAKFRVEPNQDFNARVSFAEPLSNQDMPTVSFAGGPQKTYLLIGDGFEFPVAAGEQVLLTDAGSGRMAIGSRQSAAGRGTRILARFVPAKSVRPVTRELGEAEIRDGRLFFRPSGLNLNRTGLDGRGGSLASQRFIEVRAGDQIRTVEKVTSTLQPGFTVADGALGVLVGPAWVMGSWRLTANGTTGVPWVGALADAAATRAANLREEGRGSDKDLQLTLDEPFQQAVQGFVRERARQHHAALLAGGGRGLPPRIALSAVEVPTGDVKALGGWPRQSTANGFQFEDGEVVPGVDWVDGRAPRTVRLRYGGDRNFDLMVLGSATKPLWASAVLSLWPSLDTRLAVTGDAGRESEVFGIDLGKAAAWTVLEPSRSLGEGRWSNLTSYLARSDNRYQIRLGFLGLAAPDKSGAIETSGDSTSQVESLDGGAHPWKRTPAFPSDIEFGAGDPRRITALESTRLADQLKKMFNVGEVSGERDLNLSFWTLDESDDSILDSASGNRSNISHFRSISPEAADFSFDRVDTPRKFVTLLLGGGFNMWANVEFAGAFGAAATGLPVLPHVARGSVVLAKDRQPFTVAADKLHPGLEAVWKATGGTAHSRFARVGAEQVLERFRQAGFSAYAKTGTLAIENDQLNTSRLALVLVNEQGNQQRGVALSLVIERASMGTATELMAQFLVTEERDLRRILGVR